ncbi:hypothetical protein HRR83_003411 [Exophiala dermatitidis]|uniref:Uncharacterized protein n=1 Tax=Exophiala dermatitidis TaxID=5970 RepID=A0AAN6EW03_EXODE|nr:hypothetical protein HRR74_004429 [Exophiala dermatitidis]KAJ4521032.1 hypothetical protein HRR73_003373 [Exophiala dermatitidis]KAJ4547615.1 hypothetical protein HRR76_000247 [Exophiala dermatitidis]KAJ4553554.1 hypothetical protein HRR77_001937 [Exophiala dermatitidis]KAJ4577882.1 hypothetical protein HRR79_001207 [Exophiala dermatitidis]
MTAHPPTATAFLSTRAVGRPGSSEDAAVATSDIRSKILHTAPLSRQRGPELELLVHSRRWLGKHEGKATVSSGGCRRPNGMALQQLVANSHSGPDGNCNGLVAQSHTVG